MCVMVDVMVSVFESVNVGRLLVVVVLGCQVGSQVVEPRVVRHERGTSRKLDHACRGRDHLDEYHGTFHKLAPSLFRREHR